MKKNKKQRRIMFLLILLLAVTVGFALLSTTLFINGTSRIKANTWNIHWDSDSIEETTGSVTATTPAAVTDAEEKNIGFSVEFELPGDFYEFTADAINEGSIDGKIETISVKFYEEDGVTEIDEADLPEEITYSLTHADGSAISENEVIAHGGGKIGYKFRIGYNSEITTMPDEPIVVKPKIEITPVQHKDETPVPESRTCEQFETDSWDTISRNVSIKTDTYPLGCEKEVALGNNLGTHNVRIVNNTIPQECEGEGFSQTACGFVLEFTDIVTTHRMNPYNYSTKNTLGINNTGGWEYSDMRSYLNGTVYAYENINYSNNGLIDAFPSDLKNKIINTLVVSGHNKTQTTNFTTTDKLYLLTPKEVWGKGGYFYESIDAETRKLDYYTLKNVTTSSNNEEAEKKYGEDGMLWWLRTAVSGNDQLFFMVTIAGNYGDEYPMIEGGVSPAFRLA